VKGQEEPLLDVDDGAIDAVLSALPEAKEIRDPGLRRRVAAAFVLGLRESSFADIHDVPGEYDLDPTVNLVAHTRLVTAMVMAAADAMVAQFPDVKIDRDTLAAGSLVHDVGKIYEYDRRRAVLWRDGRARSGYPPVRHPIYGAHLALAAGLPESVVHIVASHAAEGARVRRSLEATLVATLDHVSWELLLLARRGLTIEDVRSEAPRIRSLPPERSGGSA
jgi:putative nucleotidyltransferase with HDIG domain